MDFQGYFPETADGVIDSNLEVFLALPTVIVFAVNFYCFSHPLAIQG